MDKIKNLLMTFLRILQGILWAGAMVMGIGNMPSGFGACFLLLAVFLTPGKVQRWMAEYWETRIIFTVGPLFYFAYCIPMEDVHVAARNFTKLLLWMGGVFG